MSSAPARHWWVIRLASGTAAGIPLAVLHVRCGGVRPSIGLTDHRAILYALLLLSCASDALVCLGSDKFRDATGRSWAVKCLLGAQIDASG